MDDALHRPSQGRRWWYLAFVVLTGLGVLFGGGAWWYYDRSDLDEVQRHAKKLGRPTTWKELGASLSDEKRIQTWKRLTKLSPALGSYRNSKVFRSGVMKYNLWDPVTPELLAHHASLDADKFGELVTLLDQLGDVRLTLHEEMTFRTLLPEIGVQRDLIRLMQEKLLIADRSEVGLWSRRMLASCQRFSDDSMIQYMVRVSCIEITLEGIARRLPDVKDSDPAIAHEIIEVVKDLYAELCHSLSGEYLLMFDALSQNAAMTSDGTASREWFMPLMMRAGRAPALRNYLDDLTHLQSLNALSAMTWATQKDVEFQKAKSGRITPERIIQGMYQPVWNVLIKMSIRTELHGRLIAAEILGHQWPIDSFDPEMKMLRPLYQDGRIIAAYSLDGDGLDQGGTEKVDRVFPLYAKPARTPTPTIDPIPEP